VVKGLTVNELSPVLVLVLVNLTDDKDEVGCKGMPGLRETKPEVSTTAFLAVVLFGDAVVE